MTYHPVVDPASGELYLPVALRGRHLLEEPLLNKGAAFTYEERDAFGLTGLLPHHVATLEEQVDQSLDQLSYKDSDLQKNIYLAGLQDRNETLFYRVVIDNLVETVPLIYTPTVAIACRHWSRIFRRPRGIFVTPEDRGGVDHLLRNAGTTEVAVVVITDNERILGIGDQGAGGMGIPIGKLALYTAGAGIHPSLCLPISLDVGTDNAELLEDPLYLGYRAPRLRGDAYWELVDETVHAVRRVFPGAVLQWEDFSNRTSFRLLETYREVLPSFNDDIEGTATMVTGGLYAALRFHGGSLAEQRVVIAGAGSAGIGIARQLAAAMSGEGLDLADSRSRILLTDSQGLVLRGRRGVEGRKEEFAADPALVADWGVPGETVPLEAVVTNFEPSVLIGVTGQPGTFTESMLAAMAAAHQRPIVMPLSNPTKATEAHPADLIRWSGGRAVVATGSPFDDVVHGGDRHVIGQANNVFVFPGIGLGTIVAGARAITVGMFLAAARVLAESVSDDRLKSGAIYPPITDMRNVSHKVALAVVEAAVMEGVAEKVDQPEEALGRAMWDPVYLPYRPATDPGSGRS